MEENESLDSNSFTTTTTNTTNKTNKKKSKHLNDQGEMSLSSLYGAIDILITINTKRRKRTTKKRKQKKRKIIKNKFLKEKENMSIDEENLASSVGGMSYQYVLQEHARRVTAIACAHRAGSHFLLSPLFFLFNISFLSSVSFSLCFFLLSLFDVR